MRRSSPSQLGAQGRESAELLKAHNFFVFATRHSPLATLLFVALAALAGCGYHVAGRSGALPKGIHVIAVPALENKTTSYRIEQRLTAATIHQFLAATPYKIVSTDNGADAVL